MSDKEDARWARTRQRLLDGGRKAFAERGVEATTVLEIVRAAEVSQPSFYNHFNSKVELAREIAAEFFRNDGRIKLAVFKATDDPAEAIAINIFHTISIVSVDPVITWILIKSETLRALVISSDNDPLVDMIEQGVEQGRFDACNAHTAALIIRGGTLAVMQDILNGDAEDNLSESFQELVLRMLGLASEEGARVVKNAQETIKNNMINDTVI
ncbi:MAG: TetR/AcrR family transcriptional regulator [Gammaproteobacteria bacterium]|nr:TetR/AcrR family transcriptional regulator [Gammaproteobacteria bacterium]MCP4088319.1 TetR/AcrR family transcriptional regulator [Gammaproteobacteria bacterium]MCP4276370.1 TetR/AcrR family transcriptional regulator [Gammaproteobacteria bacterium]MCP4831017.1 TetR/AcrR family transcriptional regulator [Gammaproteobacteria bacterium]MCP4927462.1 TetR/AcrR family transcriptional regulator [Gammaproteobacteria bacterium]